MEQNEEIKKSPEVDLDTDGVQDQSINVEELAAPVETELPKKRIDKLTFKVREAERREKAALDYAKSVQGKLDDTNTRFSKTSKSYIEQYSARVVAEQEKAKAALKDAIAEQDADKIAEANSTMARLAVEAEKAKMSAAEEEAKEEKATRLATEKAQNPI